METNTFCIRTWISVFGIGMFYGVYFYKNRYYFVVPWLVYYALGTFASFCFGIWVITEGAAPYLWVTLFLGSK